MVSGNLANSEICEIEVPAGRLVHEYRVASRLALRKGEIHTPPLYADRLRQKWLKRQINFKAKGRHVLAVQHVSTPKREFYQVVILN